MHAFCDLCREYGSYLHAPDPIGKTPPFMLTDAPEVLWGNNVAGL